MNNKKKQIIAIAIIILLLLAGGLYFYLTKDKSTTDATSETESTQTSTQETQQEKQTTQLPEFKLIDSKEAISATYAEAQKWSADSKLYDCSGLATSLIFSDITYEYVGYDSGEYKSWLCTYYSKSKAQTIIYKYDEGALDTDAEAIDIGPYSSSMYNSINYPVPNNVVSSKTVYDTIIANGADETPNYLNMYLKDTSGYGFVWVTEEKSRTEMDEYEMSKIVNVYIVNATSGDLITKVQDEVY